MSVAVETSQPVVSGVAITAANSAAAISETMALARLRKASAVFTLNLDHVVQLKRNPRFRAAYANANVVTADGWPIAWFARRQNRPVERTTGADLLLPLVDAAAEHQVSVFLFGTTPAVMARVGQELTSRTDGCINIAGTASPSQGFDPEGPEADAAIETIRRSGATLCFLALGAPKQEIFADHARAKGLQCCMVCVGAALDFIAGQQVRAPEVLRNHGLEWAWRLMNDPRRLGKRYLDCAAMFLYLLATEPVAHLERRTIAEVEQPARYTAESSTRASSVKRGAA